MNLENKSIATIRNLIVDSVENAKHGHMGMPLGSASMGYELFMNHMNHNPSNPQWFNRDRFVLTSGHGSILQYVLLHLSGYNISLNDLKSFRQHNSKTPGHPELDLASGIEATTGPLGQGLAMTVGMAIAEAHLGARFNKLDYSVVDHYTFTICGDGDLEEGVGLEAAAVAGNLGLGKLVVLYDSNDVTSDGPLELSNKENTQLKFESMNWHTILVEDGNNLNEIAKAIEAAKKEKEKPTLIEVKNIIGYGSTLAGTSDIHSDPVGEEEARNIKKAIGWEYDDFHIPKEVSKHFEKIKMNGTKKEDEWNDLLDNYEKDYPELHKEFCKIVTQDYELSQEFYKKFDNQKLATRSASGIVLNRIYKEFPYLIGGSADLASSNKTTLQDSGYMDTHKYEGSNIHFGVREFGMASISNGIALHGGLKAYCGTFLIFSDYMRNAIRLSALMELPVTYIMTHDSIHLGQDGPTHQPIEHLISLRAMPNLVVFRPADANETIVGWKLAYESKNRPYLLSLGRHDVPVIDEVDFEGAEKGGYILSKDSDKPDIIIISSGSEIEYALKVKEKLTREYKVNIVSLPSWELFEEQSNEYKNSILPQEIKTKVSIELGSTIGWEKFVGPYGKAIGLKNFGKSSPINFLLEDLKFSVENITSEVIELYEKNLDR